MEANKQTLAADKKRIWDNYKVIGEVKKSAAIKFVIGAGIRDGVKYIVIREFYMRKRDGVWKPGRDGITIPLKSPINEHTENGLPVVLEPYKPMIDMIKKASTELETMELADEEHAVYIVKE